MPFNSIFGWLMKKRIHQIDLFRQYPLEVQNEVFENLITQGKSTEFGKKYNFKAVKTHQDYKEKVPLQTYEEVKPWVDRLMNGEKHLLWSTDTKWFAKSSGTTSSRSKLIPVTKESLEDCHNKGGLDSLALYYSNNPKTQLYKKKHLVIGGSAEVSSLTPDSYFGDLSAIIMKNLPWWIEVRRTPAKKIALMKEWEEKIEKMAQSTIKDDVGFLVGVPSWTLVLANKVLEITGKRNLKEVWPNLELFMHGGVNFEPYREQFKKIIPDESMNYVESYNASEGFFGIQDVPNSDELLLMLDYGIFFEFIPMSSYDGVNSKEVLSIGETELNVNYAVVISTNGGLWRYLIGDTIRFTNQSPYRFKVTGRTKSFINIAGEELIVENAEMAIIEACKKTEAQVKEFTACPIYMDGTKKGAHEWLIEFEQHPDELDRFIQVLDEKLREINSDYDAKRYQSMVLNSPVVHVLKKGTFNEWLKGKGKLGGQNKIPRLSNNRDIVAQILHLAKEREV